jgi:hypothetical protein
MTLRGGSKVDRQMEETVRDLLQWQTERQLSRKTELTGSRYGLEKGLGFSIE